LEKIHQISYGEERLTPGDMDALSFLTDVHSSGDRHNDTSFVPPSSLTLAGKSPFLSPLYNTLSFIRQGKGVQGGETSVSSEVRELVDKIETGAWLLELALRTVFRDIPEIKDSCDKAMSVMKGHLNKDTETYHLSATSLWNRHMVTPLQLMADSLSRVWKDIWGGVGVNASSISFSNSHRVCDLDEELRDARSEIEALKKLLATSAAVSTTDVSGSSARTSTNRQTDMSCFCVAVDYVHTEG